MTEMLEEEFFFLYYLHIMRKDYLAISPELRKILMRKFYERKKKG